MYVWFKLDLPDFAQNGVDPCVCITILTHIHPHMV